jgi:hypothetical protein
LWAPYIGVKSVWFWWVCWGWGTKFKWKKNEWVSINHMQYINDDIWCLLYIMQCSSPQKKVAILPTHQRKWCKHAKFPSHASFAKKGHHH